MKAMPGRPSGRGGPAKDDGHDVDLSVLRSWIGDDIEHYRPMLPKVIDSSRATREKILVYTVSLGGYDTIRAPTVVNPDVRYVAITDGHAPAPWSVMRPEHTHLEPARAARAYKMNSHKLFAEADWTIYLDGQLGLTCNPLAILAECEAAGVADLYVFRHHDRDCIYAEIDIIRRRGFDQASHTTVQAKRYREMGFAPHSGLYIGGILIRRGGVVCQGFNEFWWREVSAGSHRDQISLPVAIRESGVAVVALPANTWERFVRLHPHARINRHLPRPFRRQTVQRPPIRRKP